MIRLRMPSLDDPHLFRLIERELIPYAKAVFPTLRIGRKDVEKMLDRSKVYVGEQRGSKMPIGFVSVSSAQHVLRIEMLAVEKDYQGIGWGSALMAVAETYGRQTGCTRAQLYVDESNDKAKRFYERIGYATHSFAPEYKCYLLEKTL
ncbi:GNAT family N-acetyltransferase [Paenibacillus sp. MBLB4367]|uniref:GNAT family N-acetyltransferase n=1 Tax=Paenibacillus sp. MBLB4367 TaxID=3384767 RepID=UPI0039081D36